MCDPEGSLPHAQCNHHQSVCVCVCENVEIGGWGVTQHGENKPQPFLVHFEHFGFFFVC